MKSVLLACLLFIVPGVRVAMGGVASPDGAGRATAERFGLTAWTVQTPTERRTASERVQLELTLDGEPRQIDLKPANLRADNFKLKVSDGQGGLKLIDAPPSRAYRGVTDAGGVVAATRKPEGWDLYVVEEGVQWFAEPVAAEEAASAGALIVYRSEDVLPAELTCGVSNDVSHAHEIEAGSRGRIALGTPVQDRDVPARTLAPGEFYELDIAFDCDYQYYYYARGGSIDAVLEDVESLLNAVGVVYERDVRVKPRLAGVVVRDTFESDPYVHINGGDPKLREMRNVWSSGVVGIEHDNAHLMSGAPFGAYLGFGFANGICTESQYAATTHYLERPLIQRVSIISHELGHNFDAPHCDGQADCHIMCSFQTGCDGLGAPNFGAGTIATISNYAATRPCLDIVGGNACPADLAAPLGTLNFADVQAFLAAFGTEQPEADLAAPMGTFNFADVQAFLSAFGAGCPNG